MKVVDAPPSVRASAIRVALAATGLVAVAYLLVSVAIVGIVTGRLTDAVDARLSATLAVLQGGPMPREGRAFEAPRGERPAFGPVMLVWTETRDGVVLSNTQNADLPVEPAAIGSPTTVEVAGESIRVAGAATNRGHVVVGQTLQAVGQAQSTVILAELLIAPLLLLVVFLGAVAIGRRAAAPIEAARVRQMEFTADASHELRTPLSVIEAQTSLALSGERTTDWYRVAFGRIEGESVRMRRLVEDMLWLARFDAERGAPAAEPVDLSLLAAGAVDRFASIAETRGVVLTAQAAAASSVVTAPPEWLDRLVGVFVDNAIRYAPEGGRVAVRVSREDGRVGLVVEDDGPGIPPEERSRIFDRFHRAMDASGGAGLGLAIGDAVVRATGGRWRIGESAMGGASMAITWLASEPRA